MTNDTTPAPIGADALIDELEYAILGIPMARNFDRVRAAKAALRSALASASQPADFDADRAMRASHGQAPVRAAQKYDDTLVPFLALMRRELHANSSKGDRPGWLSMRPDQCLLEIYWHAAKLSAAVKNGDQALIAEHAADVANMAMMQADIAGLLSLPTAQPAPVAQGDALTYEQSYAIRQGHEIASSDAYFEARPQIDNNDRRGVFRAGFDRGWDAARTQAKEGVSHD